jgi:aminoglycoside phosphotransferase
MTCAGPHVDHVVRRSDRLLVVLDHDDRVAEVAQLLEGADQARVVALVQSDRGLVEHVHHAGQPGADLAREANALPFAAGQGLGRAAERQIVQAHVHQELEAVGDLAHDTGSHLPS